MLHRTRSLAKIVNSARYRNKEIYVCGEVAHDFEYIPFLLGIGIRSLSVYPKFLPSVQKAIGGLKLCDAEMFAEQMLAQSSIEGAREVLHRLKKNFGFNRTGRC